MTVLTSKLVELLKGGKTYEKYSDFCKRIKKSFKDKEVLKGVNVEVQRGEILHCWAQMEQGRRRQLTFFQH